MASTEMACPKCGHVMTVVEREDRDKIIAILNWKTAGEDDTAKKFDDGFVRAMDEKLTEWGSLTPGQSGAIDKILRGFRISLDKWV